MLKQNVRVCAVGEASEGPVGGGSGSQAGPAESDKVRHIKKALQWQGRKKSIKIQNLLHLADVARSVREFCLPEKSENPHTKIPVQDALPTLPLPDTLYTTKWRHRIRQGGASCRASLSLVIGASRVKRQVNGVKELANDGAMKCCNTTTAT